MIDNTRARRTWILCLTLVLAAGLTQIVSPRVLAEDPIGLLTVTGMVKVNAKPAATGDIVASGSSVETAKGSSAVVSLGKLGRVEALPETRMHLRYDASSITVVLEAGSVRVTGGTDVNTTVVRK
jgi:hypothetical protein